MRHVRVRRAGLLVLTIALTLTAAGVRAAPAFTARPLTGRLVQGAKALTAGLARTDPELLRLHGSRLVPVVVKFDYDPVASYVGGVARFPPTSPSATGRPLPANPAAAAYERYLASREARILDRIQTAVPRAEVRYSYRLAYGGAAMSVPAGRIRDLLRVPGVVAVQADRLERPLGEPANFVFTGAAAAWEELGGKRRAGQGAVVGVLDTGIWPENPMLRDRGLPSPGGGPYACQFGDGTDPTLGPSFACNDKLLGAYAFTDTYMAFIGALEGEFCNNETGVCSARDADGHGTHTATTAAGDWVLHAPIFGIDRGPAAGQAPGASVIAYRVCLEQGCFSSDSVAAVEQAIADGVDVINYSISGGAEPFSDPVELAFLDAYAAGIVVVASAGNEGPGPGTAEHGGPWVLTVGASTWDGMFLTDLVLRGGGESLVLGGASVTPGLPTPTRVVEAARLSGYEDPFCTTPLPEGSVAGRVVVCQRGAIARIEKSYNVLQGGAAGMILYNAGHQDLFTDNHWVPTVMLDGRRTAEQLLDFLHEQPIVRASWEASRVRPVRGDEMVTFSSRGPVGDFLKPDVTAPGIQVLAGNTPQGATLLSGPPGEDFQAIAGTSMSSPHVAGIAALIRSRHPRLTAGQVRSAIITSTVQDVVKEDGRTPADPFDMGAGSVRADRALHPTLLLNETATNFALAADDVFGRVGLNLPTLDASVMPGVLSAERTVKNVSGATQIIDVRTEAPAGARIVVRPAHFTIGKGGSRRLTITLHGETLGPGQHFGRITLAPRSGATPVTIPVAFLHTQGAVTLEHTCADRSLEVGETTDCRLVVTNLASAEAETQLSLESSDPGVRVSTWSGPAVEAPGGFRFGAQLAPAVAPTVEELAAGGSPAGYLPLASLGVPPLPGIGDETIVTFDTPPFLFGSETYTQVAMTSNGYAVVGGGDAADLTFIPQDIPDPARPNNVLAGFWTDLNPESGGNLYAAEVTDGTDLWIVLEWAGVPPFTDPASGSVSFQIWIKEGATESITYAYGAVTTAGDPIGLTVGAENRDGTSAATLPGPPPSGADFTVMTSPAIPGGSVEVAYRVRARDTGRSDLVARMRSDQTPGTTVEVVRLRVG